MLAGTALARIPIVAEGQNVDSLTPVLRFLLNLIISVKNSNAFCATAQPASASPDIERNGIVNSYTPLNHPSFRRSTVTDNGHAPAPRPLDHTARVVTSESLFRGTHEIGIEHEGAMYRLKITRQGKLILNK